MKSPKTEFFNQTRWRNCHADLHPEKTPGHPLYEQLYQSIRDDIAAGRLPAGPRLPSKRVLAAHLGVSVVTVESAYAQLLAEGYAEARPRSGVYVCAIGSSVPVQPPHMPSLPQPSAPSRCSTSAAARARTCRSRPPVWVADDARGHRGQAPDAAGRFCRSAGAARCHCGPSGAGARPARLAGADLHRRGHGVPFMASSCSSSGAGCAMPSRIPATAKFSGIYAANDVTVCPIGLDSEACPWKRCGPAARRSPIFPRRTTIPRASSCPSAAAMRCWRGPAEAPGALYHRGRLRQ